MKTLTDILDIVYANLRKRYEVDPNYDLRGWLIEKEQYCDWEIDMMIIIEYNKLKEIL